MATGDWKYANARPAFDRVMDRVQQDENGCWIWPGSSYGRKGKKYGHVTTGSRRDGTRKLRSTHVVVWEHFEGPVSAGLELDHLCRVTLCCNPGHLEPVTHAVNMQRAPWDHLREARSAWMSQLWDEGRSGPQLAAQAVAEQAA